MHAMSARLSWLNLTGGTKIVPESVSQLLQAEICNLLREDEKSNSAEYRQARGTGDDKIRDREIIGRHQLRSKLSSKVNSLGR